MLYKNVCIESFGYAIPPNVVTTEAIEESLAPAAQRLGIPKGQFQMLTGIIERRWWDPGVKPSDCAVIAAKSALQKFTANGWSRDDIGALVNTSVCRDLLEPSTASIVHGKLGLPSRGTIFDISNACLGFASGIQMVANMVELGQIPAGMVVSAETGRELVENTIRELLAEPSQELYLDSLASLTIGSGAVAIILSHKSRAKSGLRLVGNVTQNRSQFHHLCRWQPDVTFPTETFHSMKTDGKMVFEKGLELASTTWAEFKSELGWDETTADRYFLHQVSAMHRNMLYATLKLDPSKDFSTVEYLGNTGSVAMPLTFALGIEREMLRPGQKAALLGIGSGLTCSMLGVEWS